MLGAWHQVERRWDWWNAEFFKLKERREGRRLPSQSFAVDARLIWKDSQIPYTPSKEWVPAVRHKDRVKNCQAGKKNAPNLKKGILTTLV